MLSRSVFVEDVNPLKATIKREGYFYINISDKQRLEIAYDDVEKLAMLLLNSKARYETQLELMREDD